ncbi:hypothetical protein [Pseudomonas yamanorum]
MDAMLKNLKSLFDAHFETGVDQEAALLRQLESTVEQVDTLETEHFQFAHARLSQLLHEQGARCLPFLIYIFEKGFQNVFNLTVDIAETKQETRLTPPEFQALYERCLTFQPREGIRILSYQLPDINPWSAADMLPWVTEMLNQCALTPIDEKNLRGDLATLGNCLGMSRTLNRKTGMLHETYCQFESVLERLSRDGHQQVARDYAEEAMVCARADDYPEYGHYCRFALATRQKNPIDAALHACLLAWSLHAKISIPADFRFRLLSAAFTFYRDFGFFEWAKRVYEQIRLQNDLGAYNRQKAATAYLNLLLLSNAPKALSAANEFAAEHLEEIKAFGDASSVPWLALICNLKMLFPERFAHQTALLAVEDHIDATLSKAQADTIKDMILPRRPNAKKYVIDLLDKLHLSRNKSDHIYEINMLQVTASRLLETSLNNGDIEGILLGHRVKSDGGLAFELSEGLPRQTLLRHDDERLKQARGKNEQYLERVKQQLAQYPAYRYLWLGFENKRLYYLIHEDGRFIAHGYIPGCSKSHIRVWLKDSLPNFAFNDSPPNQGPFMIREDIWRDESEKIRQQLPKLNLPLSKKRTLVLCDIDMACFPHNLLVEPTDDDLTQALCNPLSLDNYLRCIPSKIDTSQVSVWAPLVENDKAIQLAHGRLMEHLSDHCVTYANGLYPVFERDTDIKAFICHGGRSENGGFTGLYPSDEKKYTTADILGGGKVAILFVCHGGHVNADLYAKSFQTLAKTLLMSGYETVIAPAWSLNVVIPGPWIEVFLKSLRHGENIVDAALHANNRIKTLYPVESAWAAMHVFGNPHLSGQTT